MAYRKRNYKKKRTYKRKRKQLTLMKSPVQNKMFTKMRYYFETSFTTGVAGISYTHVVTANGLFDPDITSIGHQPRGFDQLMTLYDHYVVLGSKMTARITGNASADVVPTNFGIAIKDSDTTSSNPNDYMENSSVTSTIWSASTASRQLTKSFSTKKFLGRTNVLSDPQLKGSTAGNPTEQGYFHIFAFGQEAGSTYNVNGWVDYLVCLIEPKTPTQS